MPLRIIETVVAVNDQHKRAIARKALAAAGGGKRDKTVAVLGLPFNLNTDDMRNSPSIPLITAAGLRRTGADLRSREDAGRVRRSQR